MNLHKFDVFVHLAATLNYTQTADELFTTQGNISKQIISLEKELGISLFIRSHRTIQLSEAGKLMLPYAKNMLDNFSDMKKELESLHLRKENSLTIRTIPTMPYYNGFLKIAAFHQAHPEIQLHVEEEESFVLASTLAEGKADYVFLRSFDYEPKEYEQMITDSDQFVVVLPKKHPLTLLKVITMADLAHEIFLILGKRTNLYEPVIQLCKEAGYTPTIGYQGSRIDLILKLISTDMGISLMMKKTVEDLAVSNVVLRPLSVERTSQLGFIRKKGPTTPAADLFWTFLQHSTGE